MAATLYWPSSNRYSLLSARSASSSCQGHHSSSPLVCRYRTSEGKDGRALAREIAFGEARILQTFSFFSARFRDRKTERTLNVWLERWESAGATRCREKADLKGELA